MSQVIIAQPNLEHDLIKSGTFGRGLYALADVNHISQLANVYTILASGQRITEDERADMRKVVRDIINVIIEDNQDEQIIEECRGS